MKQFGAAISSKLIPPNDGAKFFIELIISLEFFESISRKDLLDF